MGAVSLNDNLKKEAAHFARPFAFVDEYIRMDLEKPMQLARMSWPEVEKHLSENGGIMVPIGSTEQHGPMGMIGTDAICAEAVALKAAEICGAVVAPVIAYTPAPFNTAFAGTVSVSEETFGLLSSDIFLGLRDQGFTRIYVVNGHGANLEPLLKVADKMTGADLCIRSWWDFPEVQNLRQDLYGDWEGMHATPSEISITQALYGALPDDEALIPPRKLSREYIIAHSGDRHGPPNEHRARFPDGRVGSHSVLANPEHGNQILDAAATSAAKDYAEFLKSDFD